MIIEAHRGNIQVKSEVGIGTTFRVTLPVQP
jgi:signal transduction histidine kinase